MIAVGYVVVALVAWRTLAGHFAWEAHRTSSRRDTVRPRVETWLWVAVPALLLAAIWPVTLLFAIPWPLRVGAERDEESALVGVRRDARRLMSPEEVARIEREVEIGP